VIQSQTWPAAMAKRDVIGVAKTGSGKTLGFLVPGFLNTIALRANPHMGPTILVLAPTRELAMQIDVEAQKFGTALGIHSVCVYGGAPKGPQLGKLRSGCQCVIGTPGRINDFREAGQLQLQQVNYLVMDEADRMLDMGFIPDVERIVGLLPPLRQTLFFSATLSDDIKTLSDKFVSNPKVIEVAPPASTADTVAQHLTWTAPKGKREALRGLLKSEDVKNAVIFCNRKRDISTLVTSLKRHDFSAVALHGDMTQSARLEALQKFKDGEVPLMIASDVAARGLDIAGLSHVFNFDVPGNAEDYVHRIGRTGRAGKSGRAFTIAAGEDDRKYVAAIEKLIGKSIPLVDGEAAADPSETADSKPARSKAPRSKAAKANANGNDPAKAETKSEAKPRAPAESNRGRGRGRSRKAEAHPGELPPPPDCKGDTLHDTGHVPAFLLR
ncbi:MAG: DEAD/DEAH box helicase, partial [Pseudomonadota bacterium]|nr:DEAD/DEAH box helicase [Pseudomonadota bacterium]